MKPTKPCKAWALVDNSGNLTRSMYGPPMLRHTKGDIALYELYDDRDQRCSRPVRVRIIEDAAVKWVIACLRDVLPDAIEGALTSCSDDEIRAAIRDLGGKP